MLDDNIAQVRYYGSPLSISLLFPVFKSKDVYCRRRHCRAGNPSTAAHKPRTADNQNPTTSTSNFTEEALSPALTARRTCIQGTHASYQLTHDIPIPDLRWVSGYGYLPILVFARVGNKWVTQYPKITGRVGIFQVGKK